MKTETFVLIETYIDILDNIFKGKIEPSYAARQTLDLLASKIKKLENENRRNSKSA
jgi:hypothetical protein